MRSRESLAAQSLDEAARVYAHAANDGDDAVCERITTALRQDYPPAQRAQFWMRVVERQKEG